MSNSTDRLLIDGWWPGEEKTSHYFLRDGQSLCGEVTADSISLKMLSVPTKNCPLCQKKEDEMLHQRYRHERELQHLRWGPNWNIEKLQGLIGTALPWYRPGDENELDTFINQLTEKGWRITAYTDRRFEDPFPEKVWASRPMYTREEIRILWETSVPVSENQDWIQFCFRQYQYERNSWLVLAHGTHPPTVLMLALALSFGVDLKNYHLPSE